MCTRPTKWRRYHVRSAWLHEWAYIRVYTDVHIYLCLLLKYFVYIDRQQGSYNNWNCNNNHGYINIAIHIALVTNSSVRATLINISKKSSSASTRDGSVSTLLLFIFLMLVQLQGKGVYWLCASYIVEHLAWLEVISRISTLL